ncbi:MAG: M20/M25/M40 family metallo-hydrolase [Bacteroidia bacterium]|nr:M20/M25/M40 family metallo-hydrolase [Bacteroidia bacterium]MDW8348011.1 M20/M25/M40 family metallo-hydrolase [Bacteroidia bacterium]
MCGIPAPSGSESVLSQWLSHYLTTHVHTWRQFPKTYIFQDCLIWIFGEPRTAIFTHLDSTGFTVGYQNELIPIGSPEYENGTILVGQDKKGKIEAKIRINEQERIFLEADREIERGTTLTFKPFWYESKNILRCCYMDNRAGLWVTLRLCEKLKNGAVVFSCYEEHGGGTVGFLANFIQKKYGIQQSLICDITWATSGIKLGKGVVISMRDRFIPRRKYLDTIISLAVKSGIPFQLEVESDGGSDGSEIQRSPILMDWCFVGAPEENVHAHNETIYKKDLINMVEIYEYLIDAL